MKKVLLLLLFITTGLNAQIPIGQPTDLEVCDNGNDGIETFDLTLSVPVILNGLNPLQYSVSFYSNFSGAFEGLEGLELPTIYTNTTSPEMIYVRVEEIADPTNFEIATFELVVNILPMFNINDAVICQGFPVILDSNLTGPNLSFEWRIDDIIIPGANTGLIEVYGAGTYQLLVTNVTTGCTFEDSSVITLNPSAVATLSGDNTINAGETASVYILGTPNATVLYSLNNGGVINSQQVTLDASGNLSFLIPNITTFATVCLIEATANAPFCTTALSDCLTIVANSTDFINIPDTNFKTKLLSSSTSPFNIIAKNDLGSPIVIDVNANGEIEENEALLVYFLSVRNSGIADLTGIEYFTNLKWLEVDFNPLTSLSTAGLVNLEHLASYNCSLTTANLNDSVNLKTLMLLNNQLTALNISNLVNLEYLTVGNNQLTSLDLANMPNLLGLYCENNFLTELNVNNLASLEGLDCANNLLSNLSIDNLVNLTGLSFGNTGLNEVVVNNLVNLANLNFYGGLQTTMEISNLVNLTILTFSKTNLTEIDASNNPSVGEFMVSENPDLTYLNVKDGTPDSYISVTLCPNLIAICANEEDVEQLYASIIIQGDANPNLSVTSYCDFTPGGNYNTIKGSVVYDFANDGCDDNDAQPFIKMNINDGTQQGYSFSSELGNYNFYTQEGDFIVTPQLENASLFTVSPANATVNFLSNNNSVSTHNFCITANGVVPNAEIIVAPVTPARPGFDAEYKIVYKNTGNQVLSGQVYLYYNDPVLDFIIASAAPDAQTTGLLTWNYANLQPFESRSINITLNVNGPMETPAVNIDDELIFNVGTNPINGNEIVFPFYQTVVGSFDPNDIICLQGDNVAPSEIGNYLHYIINFENTGTAPAENIVVKVEIDPAKYDVSSLQILNGSHPVEARVNNNIVEFIFKSINLNTNGHGNILLKVKSKETLNVGDTVTKKANIFFDYNFPIETNDANTTFQDLGIGEHNSDASITIYPNPTKDVVNIKADSDIKSIQIYDVQGRLLMTSLSNQTTEKVDLSNYSTGIYYLDIATERGNKTQKMIKE